MARIRTIKPEFFTSEQIVECSTSARLLLVGLLCFCDDRGVHPASFKRLKMEVFPGDDIDESALKSLVNELRKNKLVVEYRSTTDDETYWHITGFSKHQRVDRPTYKYPLPPPDSTSIPIPLVECSSNDRRALDYVMEGNGRESKGDEGKGMESSGQTRKTKTQFAKPSVDMLRAFATEKNLADHAENFFDYYESVGWKVGKNAMKDWKASYRRWCRNEASRSEKRSRLPTPEEDAEWNPTGE